MSFYRGFFVRIRTCIVIPAELCYNIFYRFIIILLYKKETYLWLYLITNRGTCYWTEKMNKKDFQAAAKLIQHAMGKLSKDKAETTDTLAKICGFLDCSFDNIMEVLPEEKEK